MRVHLPLYARSRAQLLVIIKYTIYRALKSRLLYGKGNVDAKKTYFICKKQKPPYEHESTPCEHEYTPREREYTPVSMNPPPVSMNTPL